MHTTRLCGLLLAGMLLAGCSGSDGDATAADAGATLTVEDFAFEEVTVAPGTTITVSNSDGAQHTVTGDGFDVSVAGGSEGTFDAPSSPGTYALTCRIHPSMAGTLTVS